MRNLAKIKRNQYAHLSSLELIGAYALRNNHDLANHTTSLSAISYLNLNTDKNELTKTLEDICRKITHMIHDVNILRDQINFTVDKVDLDGFAEDLRPLLASLNWSLEYTPKPGIYFRSCLSLLLSTLLDIVAHTNQKGRASIKILKNKEELARCNFPLYLANSPYLLISLNIVPALTDSVPKEDSQLEEIICLALSEIIRNLGCLSTGLKANSQNIYIFHSLESES